ncbi:40-kDa huntingtin-associated protein-like isoform X1 [Ptychodera flava]|uniref:40-kDa huntingtin-associated protein-like isoform X1 n=1 Tax=Ptychodera flava TaxID=63121 RepID=UPI003969C86C
MERDVDFLGKYRAVSSKLKKRFLRKPNVAEASEQFGTLARTLENQECAQYAGLCCLAQARCEQTLANYPGEAHAITEAARLFLQASEADRSLQCTHFDEHLNAAINCYNHAMRILTEQKQPALAATLSLQLGNYMRGIGKPSEAMGHYQRAAELQFQHPLDCLTSLGHVASCKIDTRDYEGALTVLTEMEYLAKERGTCPNSARLMGAFTDIVASCEKTRVLLLMLLQPTPQRIRPEHAQTLERYAWESIGDNDAATSCLSEEMFLLLQSLVMACQSKDTESLKLLQTDLWPHLSAEQNHLLHLVISELDNPSGEGV